MFPFRVAVFDYDSDVANIATYQCEDWTGIVKDLVFSTKSPGGFAECSFRVNTTNAHAFQIYSQYHHKFVLVSDGAGEIAWQGRIESITYEPGQATIVCNGLWSSAFDDIYDDGSFSGDPGTEHSIINEDSTLYINSTNGYIAQTFQLAEDLAIRDIQIRLVNDGALAGEYIRVWLAEDNSGTPSANYLGGTPIDIQCETIASTESIFTGISTSYRLNANTTYWIIIGVNSSTVTANKVGWRYDSSAGYTSGAMYYYTSSWAAVAGGADAIFYVWTHPRFYYYSVDLENGDFEDTAGAGTFDDWTDSAGTGSIAIETTNVYEGTNAAKLTAGSGTDTYIYQELPVVKGSEYTLSFYTRGDGTYAGRYRIYDVTNSADIVATSSTSVTGTTYTLVEDTFSAPASCERIRIYFYCPSTNGGIAYFDYASLDGDYSTGADIIYDAITQSNFIQDSVGFIEDDGIAQANPIAFTNNEKPGGVIAKILGFGSVVSGVADTLFGGVYNGGYFRMWRTDDGMVWRITPNNMPAGQQALALTTDLSGMKTRIAVLYSGTVGERTVTTWVPITEFVDRFGYNRSGVYSIAGATEATADIVADVVAKAYSKPAQTSNILVGPTVMNDSGASWPSWAVRAGDIIYMENVVPSPGDGVTSYGVKIIYVQETSFDASTGRLSIAGAETAMMIVDVILALAGLSGGSMI